MINRIVSRNKWQELGIIGSSEDNDWVLELAMLTQMSVSIICGFICWVKELVFRCMQMINSSEDQCKISNIMKTGTLARYKAIAELVWLE